MFPLRRIYAVLTPPLAVAVALAFSPIAPAAAQQASGVNPGRDCQTVRTCNFTRNGRPRGCFSSYTCRVCRTVVARCNLAAGYTKCRQLVCTWGG